MTAAQLHQHRAEFVGPPAPCYLVCIKRKVLAVTYNPADAKWYREHGYSVRSR